MKEKMQLPESLALYINEHDADCTYDIKGAVDELQRKIQQGFEEFICNKAKEIKCFRCDGEGRTSCNEPAERDTCEECKGTGKLKVLVID